MRTLLLLVTGFSYFLLSSQSQGAFSNRPDDKVMLLKLIDKDQFLEAEAVFAEAKNGNRLSKYSASYFEALLSLALDKESRKAISFAESYSNSKEKNDIKNGLGDHFYRNRDYKASILWYQQASISEPIHIRQYGDALYAVNYEDLAAVEYGKLTNTEFRHHANFQLGTIYWNRGDKEGAIRAFTNASKNQSFIDQSAYYIAWYHFDNQSYDQVLKYIPVELSIDTPEGQELLKMKAKSLQELGKFQQAFESYEQLENKNRGTADEGILWNYAQVAIEVSKTEKAIDLLNSIVQRKSNYQQEASFRLGLLFIELGNSAEAIPSFQLARQGKDRSIIRKALLNLAQSQFEVGLYDEVISTAEGFQNEFPNENKKLIAELLSSAHLRSSDFEETIAYIESQEIMSPTIRQIYQLVSFENGRRFFYDQSYDQAYVNLQKSISNPTNAKILERSQFLLAEIHSIKGEYSNAIPFYKKLIASVDDQRSILSQFGLAYALYNSKSYEDAIVEFESLNKRRETPKLILTEADLRIADGHFVLKNYEEAIKYYKPLRKTKWSSYVNYQLGQIFSFKEEYQEALSYFESIIEQDSSTSYKADATANVSQIHLDQLDFGKSIRYADAFLSHFRTHERFNEVLLTKAIAATNLKQFETAETALTELFNRSTNEASRKNALLALQNLQSMGHSVPGFQKYLDQFSKETGGDEDLVNIAYESAKASYFGQELEKAIDDLLSFKSNYENNIPRDFYFYLGDAYLRVKQHQEAIYSFDKLLELGAGRLQERVYSKRGEALLNMENYEGAMINFEAWRKVAKNDREYYNSGFGMLICYQAKEDWASVVALSDQLENANWKPFGSESELALIKGNALLNQGKLTKAADEYILIMNSQEGEKAAEAYLMFAKAQALDSNYSQSNETLLQLIADYASYPTYTQTAFLYLIDNYSSLGNTAQATAIAQSIIDNGTDSVFVAKAREKLEIIVGAPDQEKVKATQNK